MKMVNRSGTTTEEVSPPGLPGEAQDGGAAAARAVWDAEAHVSAAEAGVALLEARVHLADAALARARALLAGPAQSKGGAGTGVTAHMSIDAFAAEMCVSKRKMQYDLHAMTEGVHYHYQGTRLVIHGPEAAAFLRSRKRGADPDTDLLAVDEVTRRRARAALKMAGGSK